MIRVLSALVLLLSFSINSFAGDKATKKDVDALSAAEEKLHATFSNYQITDFKPSPIPGIYEIHAGSQINYFAPEAGVLIFGQFFNSAGENLTEKSRRESMAVARDSLPLDAAITIRKGKIPLIEITNPDCGYCRKYDAWMKNVEKTYDVERKVVFMENDNFRGSKEKILAVVCAKDPIKAYENMSAGDYLPNSNCKQAKEKLAQFSQITNGLGVGGTPTFLLPDGQVIIGFKPNELENYFLKSLNTKD